MLIEIVLENLESFITALQVNDLSAKSEFIFNLLLYSFTSYPYI